MTREERQKAFLEKAGKRRAGEVGVVLGDTILCSTVERGASLRRVQSFLTWFQSALAIAALLAGNQRLRITTLIKTLRPPLVFLRETGGNGGAVRGKKWDSRPCKEGGRGPAKAPAGLNFCRLFGGRLGTL